MHLTLDTSPEMLHLYLLRLIISICLHSDFAPASEHCFLGGRQPCFQKWPPKCLAITILGTFGGFTDFEVHLLLNSLFRNILELEHTV